MRWVGRTILILLALVGLAVPALWIGRDTIPPRLARWAINRAAGAEVIDDLQFRIADLSTDHLSLIGLRVNGDGAFVAERVRLEFDPRELLHARLKAVVLTGPALGISVGPDGTAGFGSLDKAVAAFSGGEGEAGAPPVRRLELHDARVRLKGGMTGELRAEGAVVPSSSGLVARLDWRLDAETAAGGPLQAGVVLAADGRAAVERTPDGTQARLTVASGRMARGTMDATGLHGRLTLALPVSGSPMIDLEVSADRAAAGEALLAGPSLHLHYDVAGVTATARLGPDTAPEIEIAAEADAAGADDRRAFRIDGHADLARLDALVAAWADRPGLGLSGKLHAELAGRAPLDDPNLSVAFARTVASGGMTIGVDTVALPDPVPATAHGDIRMAIALAAGRLSLETAQPATIDVAASEPPADDAGALGEFLSRGPWHLVLGDEAAPARIMVTDPFGDARAEIAGRVHATGSDGQDASLAATASMQSGPEGWSLDRIPHAELRIAGLRHDGVEVERLAATADDISMPAGGPDGRFSLDLRASAAKRGVTGAVLAAAGRISTENGEVRVTLSKPGRLTVDRLAPAAPVAPTERLIARIAATDTPVLTIPSDRSLVAVRLPLDLPALGLESATAGAWRVALDPTRVTAEAWFEPDGGGRLRARLHDAAAEVGPAGIALEGLAVDLRMGLGPDGARLERIDFAARRVADRARLARFTPLSLEGFARGADTKASPDRLAFKATLRGADGAFVLDATGYHSPGTGHGDATLKLFPIRFVPGGLQPADLSPAAAALFRGASGEVELGGRVRWPGQAVPPDDPLTLTIRDLGFTGSLGTVTGLGGAIAITRVDPPETAKGQLLTAKAADFGVPIVAPRIRFHLESEHVLRLEQIEAGFAGGRVSAEDVAVPLDGTRPVPVVLTVESVDAAALAKNIDLDGLSATGTLSGWLPLLWDPKTGLAVRQARLSADAKGGTLRYAPESGPPALQDSGEQVSLLLKAIRNFVYQSLEIEADGRPGEPFDVKLRLRGANPDLYDGYPIDLNVTLTGALDQLFANVRRSLGLTDVIRRRLEASGG